MEVTKDGSLNEKGDAEWPTLDAAKDDVHVNGTNSRQHSPTMELQKVHLYCLLFDISKSFI